MMELRIKRLTRELYADYLDFFDNRAFTDSNPNGPCYCSAAIMTADEIKRMESEFGGDCKGTLRRYAAKQLDEGRIRGYLAMDGGLSIGWCNAADMDSYAENDFGFIPDFAKKNRRGKTISVVCFEIAPEYRGMGVASAFLSRICEDAAMDGYDSVEGYAKLSDKPEPYDFSGPARLHEKSGFAEVMRRDGRAVMRKSLR